MEVLKDTCRSELNGPLCKKMPLFHKCEKTPQILLLISVDTAVRHEEQIQPVISILLILSIFLNFTSAPFGLGSCALRFLKVLITIMRSILQ